MSASPQVWLLIVVFSAVGALARFGLDRAVHAWASRRGRDLELPWGIALVNLTGCLLVGVLAGAAGGLLEGGRTAELVLVAQVGLLGSFTTFSTWTVDVVRLIGHGRLVAASVNALGSLVGGGLLVVLGLVLGSALSG